MKISIDTREDSHEEIRKVIKMLQSLVGDAQETFTNQSESSNPEAIGSPFANIFGDTSSIPEASTTASETTQETQETQSEETSQSTEDLFAELFSEEEIKKMDASNVKNEGDKEDDEIEVKPKDKKYNIELY